jgi:hypothetical protein
MGLFSCFTGGKVHTTDGRVPDFANNPHDWNFKIKIIGCGDATPGIMTVTRQLLAQKQLAEMLAKK